MKRRPLQSIRGLLEGFYSADRGTTIQEVIRRWQDDGDKLLDDSLPMDVPVRDVWPHREYTWTREDARLSAEEWDALKASIRKEGFRRSDPIHVQIGRKGGVKVGEGNHRLAIAREIGLRTVPVWFHFYTGPVRKSPRVAAQAENPPSLKRPKKPKRKSTPLTPADRERIEQIKDLLGLG